MMTSYKCGPVNELHLKFKRSNRGDGGWGWAVVQVEFFDRHKVSGGVCFGFIPTPCCYDSSKALLCILFLEHVNAFRCFFCEECQLSRDSTDIESMSMSISLIDIGGNRCEDW